MMTQNFRIPARVLLAACATAFSLRAQDPPRRLVFADTAGAPRRAAAADTTPSHTVRPLTLRTQPAPAPAPTPDESGFLRNSFVRDQSLLGLAVYAPSFASTVTNEPVAWTATYLVVGAGSYFAASELSRNIRITEPMSWLATQSALRGGLAGWGLMYAGDANRHDRAAGVFFGSIAGTTAALVLGRGMTDGEVAATTFGADLGAAAGLGVSHMADPDANGRARAGLTAIGALAGYPIGYLYARMAPYRVTPGDVTTLWAASAVGGLAGSALIANGHPAGRTVAAALTAGALLGAVVGDRLLVQRFDHSPEEGQIVGLWAAGGGLMGAGVAALTGAQRDHLSGATAALMTAGAVGGVFFAERYLTPSRGGPRALSRLRIDPAGVLAVMAGQRGTHSLLGWTF